MIDTRFWARVVEVESGCWEWMGALTEGYGFFRIGNGERIGAHRVAWMLTKGEIPNRLLVCHHCDNRKCVNPEHLFLGTQSDNMQDAMRKGRMVVPRLKGEDAPGAKLSAKDVVAIRKMLKGGKTQTDLAAKYNVTQSNISRLASGDNWSHV